MATQSLLPLPVSVHLDAANPCTCGDCALCDDDAAETIGIELAFRTAVLPPAPPTITYEVADYETGFRPWAALRWTDRGPDADGYPRQDCRSLGCHATELAALAACTADAGRALPHLDPWAEETAAAPDPAALDWWAEETGDRDPSGADLDYTAGRLLIRAAAFALGRGLGRRGRATDPAPAGIVADEGLLEEFERGLDRALDEEEIDAACAERYAPAQAWHESEVAAAGRSHNPAWTNGGAL